MKKGLVQHNKSSFFRFAKDEKIFSENCQNLLQFSKSYDIIYTVPGGIAQMVRALA